MNDSGGGGGEWPQEDANRYRRHGNWQAAGLDEAKVAEGVCSLPVMGVKCPLNMQFTLGQLLSYPLLEHSDAIFRVSAWLVD